MKVKDTCKVHGLVIKMGHDKCRRCYLGDDAYYKEKNRLREVRTVRHRNNSWRKTRYCRGCGEDPYCYCGDGTPYSY